MEAKLPQQPRRAHEACHEEAEENDDRTADDVELVAVGQEQLAQRRGARAQQHEDGGEAKDEADAQADGRQPQRSEEHTSELQSLMRISYAVFCLKKKMKTRRKASK